MKVLLTGGAGYIGSHTAVSLCDAGHEVVIFDNYCNSSRSTQKQLQKILDVSLKFIEGDIRNQPLIEQVLSDNKIDAVIHLAGLKAVGESAKYPLQYYDNNVVGSVCLLQAVKKMNVKKFVFSSSATVYGHPQYLPYDEDHPTHPFNPYGRSKLQVEQILMDLSLADPSLQISILRYFNPVGAHESGLIGENPCGEPNNLMPYIGQVADHILPILNIFGSDYETQDGTAERDYIHVVDLAEGHVAALRFISSNPGCHLFNLGTGMSTSVLELVASYEEILGNNIPQKFVDRRIGDLPIYYAKPDKAEKLLAWKARRSLNDMCASAWKWQQTSKLIC